MNGIYVNIKTNLTLFHEEWPSNLIWRIVIFDHFKKIRECILNGDYRLAKILIGQIKEFSKRSIKLP